MPGHTISGSGTLASANGIGPSGLGIANSGNDGRGGKNGLERNKIGLGTRIYRFLTSSLQPLGSIEGTLAISGFFSGTISVGEESPFLSFSASTGAFVELSGPISTLVAGKRESCQKIADLIIIRLIKLEWLTVFFCCIIWLHCIYLENDNYKG